MPFSRPALPELRQRTAADIERHSGQKATSRGDIYFPLSQAIAGVAHGLHGHLAYNADQLFDDSADDENLLRRAAEMGIFRIAAARASGSAIVKGSIGARVLKDTLLQDDQQRIYRVAADYVLIGTVDSLHIEAQDSGLLGNLAIGTSLSFLETILDIESDVSVTVLSGGADIESIMRVKIRLAERRKRPPMGGNKDDYEAWAKQGHVDVTRAWCISNGLGTGTVLVRFVTDNLASPIPTAAHVAAVNEYMDKVRPAGMKSLTVIGPAAKALSFSFTRLTPNTPSIRAAINEELIDLIRREGAPGCTLYLSQINEAISLATGERDHRISLTDDFICATGEFPTLGVIS